jgi:hypothetical protein
MDTAELVITQPTGPGLHFRTGVLGRIARFVVRRRATGDPVDATIVLPFLIFLIMMWLNELGRVDESFVLAGLAIPPFLAGAWIVIRLGSHGFGRAMLRGVLVGALQAMALTIFTQQALSQHKAIELALLLMWLNSMFFWMGAHLLGNPFDILTVTEEQWQKAAPLRAKIEQITRLVFRIKDGVPTSTGLLVFVIRVLGPIVLLAYVIWALGGNPWVVLKSKLSLPS